MRGFRKQFEIVKALELPLFLHERNCDDDLIHMFNEMDPNHELRGCVHSYTGTKEHVQDLLKLGFFIGFNGSGMRTEESLDVIRSVPLNRILIETGRAILLVMRFRRSLLLHHLCSCFLSICQDSFPLKEAKGI